MGMSRLSAMMIQGNEVKCCSSGPFDDGKYGGGIYLIKDGAIHTPIVTVDYGFYESKEDAIEKLNTLVQEIRKIDIFEEKKTDDNDE